MRKMIYIAFLSVFVLHAGTVEIAKALPNITLSGKAGGKVDGTAWDSKSMRGKVTMLFYVDPDKRDLNDKFGERLKAQKFDHSRYQSVVVVNLAATWLPNGLLEPILEKKQKKFPRVTYVLDKDKKLVKAWGLKDDAYHIVLFDKNGKVLMDHVGKVDDKIAKRFIAKIKSAL